MTPPNNAASGTEGARAIVALVATRKGAWLLHGDRATEQRFGCGVLALLCQHLAERRQRERGIAMLGASAALVGI